MIIHAGSRHSGKTTKAIIMAASTKSLLLTPNSTMADYIRSVARDIGYHVETVSIQHYLEYKQHYRGRKLVIDELDTVLRGSIWRRCYYGNNYRSYNGTWF